MRKSTIILTSIALSSLVCSAFAAWTFHTVNETPTLEATPELDVHQLFNVTYNSDSDSNIPNTASLPQYAFEDEDLVVTGIKYTYFYEITMGGEVLEEGTDFTVSENTLTVFNVTGDVNINGIKPITTNTVLQSTVYDNTKDSFAGCDKHNTNYSEAVYSGNNGNFQYTQLGGLTLNSINPVPTLNRSGLLRITNNFSLSVTLKTDFNLKGDNHYANSVIGIIQSDGANSFVNQYILWLGFYKGFLHVYAFRQDTSIQEFDSTMHSGTSHTEETRKAYYGFMSIKINEKWNEKLINLQVIATKKDGNNGSNENFKVYLNGVELATMKTQKPTISYNMITIGDLRVGRNLKFNGYIYDISLYNKRLTTSEIAQNWKYSNKVWKIDQQ